MTRLNAFILLLLTLSGLYLVKIAYESRSLFVALDRAQNEERALDTEFEKLQVDKRGQATPMRVEKMAREKLGMLPASPAVTQYVPYAPPTAAARSDAEVLRDGVPLRPGEESAPSAAGSRIGGHP